MVTKYVSSFHTYLIFDFMIHASQVSLLIMKIQFWKLPKNNANIKHLPD